MAAKWRIIMHYSLPRGENILMKLHLDASADSFVIDSYGSGFVQINGRRHTKSMLLTADGIVAADLPATAAELTGAHLQRIVDLGYRPEVFLLGAGWDSATPTVEWLAPFAQVGIALEIMSLPAVCRTYNVLQGDGRSVAAIFLFG